jgi:hypothetical protein
MDARRLLPLSGVAFVVLAVLAVVVLGGETPSSDASAAEVFSFYDDHTVRQGAAAFVFAVSVPFLVFFGVSLATTAWREGADRRPVWQYVLIGGSVLTGAVLLMSAWVHFALADGADNKVSPEALQGLNVLDADSWIAFNAGLGVMMLGAAGCMIPRIRAALPAWLGWTALVLGIALFIPFADFIALILTLLWIIVVSIMLFRASAAPLSVPASPGA